MNGKGRKRKGSNAEREVADKLTTSGFPCRRSPLSGALHIKGDLVGTDKTLPLHFEIKRHETTRLHEWIVQAKKDCPVGMDWTVVHRRSNEPWYATIELDTLIKLLQLAYDIQDKGDKQGTLDFSSLYVDPDDDLII